MTSGIQQDLQPTSRSRRALAWSVHLFTACGVICCLLAVEATNQQEWRLALLWLVAAVAIDAIDGTLARRVGVKQVVPQFDGALLDNLVDYISYVLVPALIIHRSGLLPAGISLGIAGAICLASAYQFCQDDAKTPDHFFLGFPSYWNVAALYLLAMNLSPVWNAVILVILIVMVFIPIKYLYITRTTQFRTLTWALTIVWSLMMLGILWQLPQPPAWLIACSLLYVLYYVAMSLYLTLQTRSSAA